MVELISKIRSQVNALFGDMQPHQKVTLVTLGLMIMVPFGLLIFGDRDGGEVPLQYGAAFDSVVQAQAEQALLERGYNDFKSVGQRILAPASKVDEYNGALMAAGISSPHAYDELESALKQVNPFTPQNQFAALMDMQLSKKIRNNLRAIDGISDAQVIWSRPESQSRWDRSGGVKASVHVTPDGGRELPRRLVESLRHSVATMVPDLVRDNVVVIDRSTGKSWAGDDPDAPFDNELEELRRSRAEYHRNRISEALRDIVTGAIVAVNVEFDDIMSSRERRQEIDKTAVELVSEQEIAQSTSNEGPSSGVPGTASNQPRDLAASTGQQASTTDKSEKIRSKSAPSVTVTETERVPLTEKSLRVSVSIPEGHIEKLVMLDGVPEGSTDQEKTDFRNAVGVKKDAVIADVKQLVSNIIPPNPLGDSVVVTTHRRIEPDVPEVSIPLTNTLMDLISTWSSSVALALFGLWALLLLKKSMPVSEAAPSTAALDKLTEAVTHAEAEVPVEEPKIMTNRDAMALTVESDPAVAAAVLTRWLENA